MVQWLTKKTMGIDALDLAFRLEKQFGINVSKAECLGVLFDTT